MRLRSANNRARRMHLKYGRGKYFRTIRMGRCPTLWHWNDDPIYRLMGVPMNGYITYRGAHK